MYGNNKLFLNTATMINIVQQWVDRELQRPDGHKVTDVVHKTDGGGTVFEITLSSPPLSITK